MFESNIGQLHLLSLPQRKIHARKMALSRCVVYVNHRRLVPTQFHGLRKHVYVTYGLPIYTFSFFFRHDFVIFTCVQLRRRRRNCAGVGFVNWRIKGTLTNQGPITVQLISLCEIMGGMLPMCQNTTMRVYGARIKRYCVYVQNI